MVLDIEHLCSAFPWYVQFKSSSRATDYQTETDGQTERQAERERETRLGTFTINSTILNVANTEVSYISLEWFKSTRPRQANTKIIGSGQYNRPNRVLEYDHYYSGHILKWVRPNS